jgi:hypothetical protein
MINFPTPTALNEPFVSPDGRRWFWNGVAWQAQAKQLALAEISDFPTAPQTGTKVLQVNNGTVAWVDPAGGGTQANWNSASGPSQILNKPTLGTAAATDSTAYATAAQGTKADSASQPGHNHSLGDLAVSGATSGQVPTWNGTAWTPQTPSGGGSGSSVVSDTTGMTGASQLTNIVQITQAGYNAIATPNASTLYIIVG